MEIVIIIGLILLNGILAMSEIALVSARKARLETEAKRGNKSAGTALKLANEPDKFLSTIQIGITLIGILTGLYSGEALAHNFAVIIAQIPALEPYALGIAKTTIVIIVTYLTLIFGELVPKRIGMGCAEKVSMLVAKPMNFLSLISSPFVWLLSKSTALAVKMTGVDTKEENRVTEEEIKAIVKEGFDGGEVQEVEQDIVERVFNLGDRNVGSIMTHRSELVWLDVTDSTEKIREKVEENAKSAGQLEQELERLMREKFLTPEQAQSVEKVRIERLFAAPFGARILQAEKLHREFKFSLLTDAVEFAPAAAGEQVMLQGVVDCFWEEADGIVLVDFKTDRTPDGPQACAARYCAQLNAYAKALTRIYGAPVKEKILYFFSCDCAYHLD